MSKEELEKFKKFKLKNYMSLLIKTYEEDEEKFLNNMINDNYFIAGDTEHKYMLKVEFMENKFVYERSDKE